MKTRRARTKALVPLAALFAASLAACGGGGGGSSADGGETITMWTRAATQAQSERLVKAYNAAHDNQVELTAVPTDNYPARLAAAAGARELPDVFAADVIFGPKFTAQGLWRDITDRVNELPYSDSLAPSHIELGTREGKVHAVPHTLDLSVLFYNKELYEKAGLDPEKPPTTLEEFADHARTIRSEIGGDTYGTFFGGNCPGCYVFTFWPSVWAAGGDIMNGDGTQSTINDPAMARTFEIWRGLWEDGVAPDNAKTEQGPTWTGFFGEGNIGVMPMPSTMLGLIPEDVETGVAPIPGPDGGESTFVGGDIIGISSTTDKVDAAWDFVSWTLSEEAQVEVLAKNHDVLGRTDLADNKYSAEDPRVVLMNELVAKGRTPYALNFQQTYNDPQGPWLQVARDAAFGPVSVEEALEQGIGQLTSSLQQQ